MASQSELYAAPYTRPMIQRALIVCVGNICRSPTAEVLMRHALADKKLEVESAGLAALAGKPIDPVAEAVLQAHGLTGKEHVARQVTPELISQSDLILAMEKRHLAALHAIAPQARGKTFLLGRWHGDCEVPDPYGKPREKFDEAYSLIERLLAGWHRHL
jgi:protein-tyrosine phosphatase